MNTRAGELGARGGTRRCVVVARDRDSARLRGLLSDRGVAVIDSTELDPGLQVESALRQAIKIADFVLAVVDGHSVWGVYEVGFAVALRKPVMLVVPKDKRAVPAELLAHPHVIAASDDLDAIGFYLDQFLESGLKSPPRLRRQVTPTPPRVASDIAGLRATLSEAHEPAREAALLDTLKSALRIAGMKYVAESNAIHEIDGRPDFAVWSDSLDRTTGNPLIIEVKTDVSNHERMRQATAQLRQYVRQAGSQWGLLLYQSGPPQFASFPHVLGLPIDAFLAAIESGSLPNTLSALRESADHGTS